MQKFTVEKCTQKHWYLKKRVFFITQKPITKLVYTKYCKKTNAAKEKLKNYFQVAQRMVSLLGFCACFSTRDCLAPSQNLSREIFSLSHDTLVL
jgi:hypothetical protein